MIFDRNTTTWTWSESQHLYASDGSSYDNFGYYVALDGDVLAATAPGDLNNISLVNSSSGQEQGNAKCENCMIVFQLRSNCVFFV